MSIGTVRRARPEDFPRLHELAYTCATEEDPDAPPIGPLPSILAHEHASGDVQVAEVEGRIVGFAAVIRRGDVAHMAESRVQTEYEDRGIAHQLLHAVMPEGARTITSFSSGELGALGLFVLAGLRPRWPALWVRAAPGEFERLSPDGLQLVDADPADRELARWDRDVSGLERARDVSYWLRERQARPFWIRRGNTRLGYAWVQGRSDDSFWYPDALTVGPVGARHPEHAADCVAAAVDYTRTQRKMVRLMVPGPHPALPGLLAAGFKITYVETFLSTADIPFFEPRCYLPSGSELL